VQIEFRGLCEVCGKIVQKPLSGTYLIARSEATWNLLENTMKITHVMPVPRNSCIQPACVQAVQLEREANAEGG